MAAAIPIVYFVIAGFMWAKTEIAWAEDVKQSAAVQLIQSQQDRVEDRLWKVKHDLRDIEARAKMGAPLATDALEKEQLLAEYRHLLERKADWSAKEKEATQ